MIKEQDCEILLLQETNRGEDQNRPKINGMTLIIERPHNKYGSAIFLKSNIAVKSASKSETNNIEILTVDLGKCSITSIYNPPNENFVFEEQENFRDNNTRIVARDFNSHSISWGYAETNNDGDKVENWAEVNRFNLIFDANSHLLSTVVDGKRVTTLITFFLVTT